MKLIFFVLLPLGIIFILLGLNKINKAALYKFLKNFINLIKAQIAKLNPIPKLKYFKHFLYNLRNSVRVALPAKVYQLWLFICKKFKETGLTLFKIITPKKFRSFLTREYTTCPKCKSKILRKESRYICLCCGASLPTLGDKISPDRWKSSVLQLETTLYYIRLVLAAIIGVMAIVFFFVNITHVRIYSEPAFVSFASFEIAFVFFFLITAVSSLLMYLQATKKSITAKHFFSKMQKRELLYVLGFIAMLFVYLKII